MTSANVIKSKVVSSESKVVKAQSSKVYRLKKLMKRANAYAKVHAKATFKMKL